ncbi:MAG: hypothetical protein HOH43_01855 [Candidatus Latescibacteria bacterium]|jgi:hypothetical protein|nr:hypothetical protein [Candidatus Latescibacterota bacterium]
MNITRLYSDSYGESHFEEIEISLEDAGEIGALSVPVSATSIIFRYTDEHYDFDWHNAPSRRYLVILDGSVDIEVSDGTSRRFGTGDVVLLEDTEGKGHLSRAVKQQPRKSLFILLD